MNTETAPVFSRRLLPNTAPSKRHGKVYEEANRKDPKREPHQIEAQYAPKENQ